PHILSPSECATTTAQAWHHGNGREQPISGWPERRSHVVKLLLPQYEDEKGPQGSTKDTTTGNQFVHVKTRRQIRDRSCFLAGKCVHHEITRASTLPQPNLQGHRKPHLVLSIKDLCRKLVAKACSQQPLQLPVLELDVSGNGGCKLNQRVIQKRHTRLNT